MVGLEGGKTIADVWQNILNLQNKTVEMDNVLKDTIAYTGTSIAQAVSGAVSKAYSSGYSAGGGGKNNNSNNINLKSNPPKTGDIVDPSVGGGEYVITLNTGYSSEVKRVKKGNSITLPSLTRSGYKFNGWDVPSKGICTSGAYTYKPTKNETVTAMWSAVASSSKVSTKTTTNYSPFITSPNYSPLGLKKYASGGLVDSTGPAWVDGTPQNPEMVLSTLQTEHFIKFVNALDKMFTNNPTVGSSSSIAIDNISFNVASMSSPEDGEAAFNMFVNKFKEIGNQTGIKINSFKNTL